MQAALTRLPSCFTSLAEHFVRSAGYPSVAAVALRLTLDLMEVEVFRVEPEQEQGKTMRATVLAAPRRSEIREVPRTAPLDRIDGAFTTLEQRPDAHLRGQVRP